MDDTSIKISSELIWLWIVIEPKNREILALTISKERTIHVCYEHFLSDVVEGQESIQFLLMIEVHDILCKIVADS